VPYGRNEKPGGPTSEANGTLLCGRHHRFVHANGWTGSLIEGHIQWRPPRPGALRVGAINVAAPFRGKAFVYRMSNLRFETDFYVEFLVPPAAMLTEQTARALEHAKPFAHVALPDGATDADWVLSGFASALYSCARNAGKPAAVLEITYYLTSSSGMEQTPVWTREYRQRVPMSNATPSAYAEALNRAFGEIVAALARDLAVAELPKS